ncbi:TPA: colicin lysis protein [Streptococcus suis]|nr:colicin lysis protein [Streptococcus suis]
MKKFISRIMLVSTVVLLAACQSIQTKEDETSNTSSSSQVTTSSDQQSTSESSSETTSSSDSQTEASSTNTQAIPTVYQSVIDRYQANMGQPAEAINQDEVNSYLSLLTSQGQEYSGIFYSLYDVNHDGTEELLLALDKSGEYVLIDLYTQLADESLRLVDNFRNLGFEIGPDALLRPLQDGTYLFEGDGIFRIYQYNAMIPGLKRISESDTNPETSPFLELKSLHWVKL